MTYAEQITALENEIAAAARKSWHCLQTLDEQGMKAALKEAEELSLRRLALVNAKNNPQG
jgi:hypothetical protein